MGNLVTAIKNANIVLETGIVWDGTILISDGKILNFGTSRDIEIPTDAKIVDANGKYVGPGFVDIHVHGGDGHCSCFDALEAAEYFLKHGTTSMLSTPAYSFDFKSFLEAIYSAREAMKKSKTIKGFYFEGPYINVKYGAYAHKNPWRAPINPDEFKALVDAAGTDAKVWTIAPEREGIKSFLEYAREVNPDVVFAVGHSEATPSQIRDLGKYRPELQTHSMCATGRLPVSAGTRGYGPDEYCFKEPDIFCELISDFCGIHVNAELQQLLIHTKGINRVVLITDSALGEPNPVPKGMEHVTDLNFDDVGGIAGSKLTMDTACRNIMMHTNCGIAQAFVMASLNPARIIKMDDEIGSIERGKRADLVFVDDRFNVSKVMLDGEICEF